MTLLYYDSRMLEQGAEAVFEGRCPPMSVEKRGKTDCRECVFWRRPFFAGTGHCCIGTSSRTNRCAIEYCGDFVEVVL